MNGIHDLGGMHGWGPVFRDPDEPLFYYDWERRILGLAIAISATGSYNVDEFRHAIERMNPTHYLRGTYYEHWLYAFETLLVEKGVTTQKELEGGKSSSGKVGSPVLTPEIVELVLKAGASARVTEDVKPTFKVGDRVRAINKNTTGHTRLPRYARGRLGIIEIDHGVFVTPDTAAHGKGQHPQHVYSVSFLATELWGADAAPKDTVRIDMWDDYLEPA